MQQDPEDLYELGAAVPDLDGVAMLHHLEGFMDAGAAGRLLAEHLVTACEPETIATFDVDRLIDYRSRRPTMTYSTDHWEDYDQPELTVRLMHDSSGSPFLLLAGPEPDHEWELFATAVRSLSDRLGTGPLVGFHGIPMGVPHTRPLGVITHATRAELVTGQQRMPGRLQVPGSVGALLELRLGQAGRDALGFAVHVPHYLAQAVYPAAAAALLDSVTAATGLDLPGAALQEAAQRTNAEIDRQVSESAEVAELVSALERQYDALAEAGQDTAGDGGGSLLDGGEIPTADELAAQFERFLAEQQGQGDTPPDR
jgi:predicted ATP-grasp superfamily ATP-dependent carboligase